MSEITQKQIFKEIRNFLIIAIAVSIGSFGWCAFVLTHKVPIGGIAGISSVLYWGTGIPITGYLLHFEHFVVVWLHLKVLGWRILYSDKFSLS